VILHTSWGAPRLLCDSWRRHHVQVAEQCLNNASDLSGLLLLTSARGDVAGLRKLIEAAEAAGRLNVAFVARFLLGDLSE
jgi:coatomer subunit beta'